MPILGHIWSFLDKAAGLTITIVIWIGLSNTQLVKLNQNLYKYEETAMQSKERATHLHNPLLPRSRLAYQPRQSYCPLLFLQNFLSKSHFFFSTENVKDQKKRLVPVTSTYYHLTLSCILRWQFLPRSLTNASWASSLRPYVTYVKVSSSRR